MTIIPPRISPMLAAIHERRLAMRALIAADEEGDSTFIRASKAYHECARAIWNDFRWVSPKEEFSARILRLLETGVMHEARIIADLKSVEGITVHNVDIQTGEQYEADIAGYIRGHLDGVVKGVVEAPAKWHLLECKTANDKSFCSIKKHGVEKSKPEHWTQVQLYMHGFELERCLYFLINKNTDEEYVERIKLDKAFVARTIERLVFIAEASRPPPKFYSDGGKPPCMFCSHRPFCHEGRAPRIHCRTCLSAKPRPGGDWWCLRWEKSLTPKQQAEGCLRHLWIPDLLPWEQIDYAEDSVTYRKPDGGEWIDRGIDKGGTI